jgi:hypothetical protein
VDELNARQKAENKPAADGDQLASSHSFNGNAQIFKFFYKTKEKEISFSLPI